MAKDKLNKLVDAYFESIKGVKVEDITIDMIKKYLNIKDTNAYGGVAHAIVNYNYDKAQIIKTIELLLEMGLDPNHKARSTGYTFIHLALYGYTTESGNDVSYSTEFIISLINLAKEKGLDVNIKDNDGDTIVHTALASEVYEGSVVSIATALKPKFKLDCVDNSKNGIIQALDKYILQAKSDRNTKWEARLLKEKDTIIDLVKRYGKSDEDLLAEKTILDKKLDKLIKGLTLEKLNSDEISQIKKEYEELNSLLGKNGFDLTGIEAKINRKITSLFEKHLKTIISNPTLKELTNFEKLISKFPFYKPSIDISATIESYKNKLKEYEINVNNATSLYAIRQARVSLAELLEEELKLKLNKILDNRVVEIERLFTMFIQLYNKNNLLISFLGVDDKIGNCQKDTITIEELNQLISIEQGRYDSFISNINQILNQKIKDVIAPFQALVDKGVIPSLELDFNQLQSPKAPKKKLKGDSHK